MIVVMAPSWILGLTMYVYIPMTLDTLAVLLPADAPQPLTAEYMDQIHTAVRPDAGVYIPSLLKDLARNPEYIDHMRHMKMVACGGAPLDREVGDLFSSFTHVEPAMGSTEVGSYGLKLSPKEDWMYYSFNPEFGWRFLPFQDDSCASVIVRHEDPEKAKTQVISMSFPNWMCTIPKMCGSRIRVRRICGCIREEQMTSSN
jgi:acyl-coenzyme A synthetase/AMP-(fatty) acid ligase